MRSEAAKIFEPRVLKSLDFSLFTEAVDRAFLTHRQVHTEQLNLKMMASKLGSTIGKLVHRNFTARHVGQRFMSSVINLSDLDATEKFRAINDKSILYFTATW